jgi:hypothetical protein
MPGMNVYPASKRTRVLNAVAAGTTTQNGSVLDMEGFESVVFDAMFGALTGTQVTFIKAQAGNAANGSDMADLAGTKVGPLADTDGNKMLTLEVARVPGFRYVRCVVVRGTANAVIDGVVATQYVARKQPTTDDATVSAGKFVNGPALGTP